MKEKNVKAPLMKRDFYSHVDAGKTFLWAIVVPYVASFLLVLIAVVYAKSVGISAQDAINLDGFLIASAILIPLSFFAMYLIYNKVCKISFKASKVKFNLNWKTALVLVSIAVICVFGLIYIVGLFDLGLEKLGAVLPSSSLPLDNGWWYVLNIVVLGVLPAICEELIFRGMIFNGLRRNIKDIWAVLISALLFMLMHGGIQQFIYPFILGIVLGWVVLRTGSVVSSMIVHMVNNILVITLQFVANMTGFDLLAIPVWLMAVLGVVLLGVTFGLLFVIEKFFLGKNKQKDEKVEEGKFPTISLIVGIVLSAVIFLFNTVTYFMN